MILIKVFFGANNRGQSCLSDARNCYELKERDIFFVCAVGKHLIIPNH